MSSNGFYVVVWAFLSILLPIGAVVGTVLVVRFFVRLSRRVELLGLSIEKLSERLDRARDADQ